jgi:hypothetical protein
MPSIVKLAGHNGEPLEIVITKDAKNKNVFRVDMNSASNKGKVAGVLTLYPVSRDNVIRLYGELIETNKSHILE